MIRKIITIDESKCVGCGLCANACHQSALKIIDGKAKLIGDDYCDGLGNCLPVCPTSAISFEQREADAFKEKPKNELPKQTVVSTPCTMAKKIERNAPKSVETPAVQSNLSNWPVQIKLVPPTAPYYDNANLLISADCCAYAYANFHSEFMKDKITIIGCPKLDDIDYSNKLTEILKNNNIKSVTIVKMEVPCCNGLLIATKNALKNSDKLIPWQIVTISTDGNITNN